MKKLIPILGFAATATAVPFAVSCSKPVTYIAFSQMQGTTSIQTIPFDVTKDQEAKLKLEMSNWTGDLPSDEGAYWTMSLDKGEIPLTDTTPNNKRKINIYWNGIALKQGGTNKDGTFDQGDYYAEDNGKTITFYKALSSSDNLAIQFSVVENVTGIVATWSLVD